ncbi:hypothetical protein MTsPCn9_05090 [Croceitalea sp. MTPC9]|nr:hypothetical protein MTsPCn6_03620 [Croceitalea sp. MTPC6]GMN15573.1 hypothetical protein MTsPCn9_05090 [Croceitalea sp. MTPC9]
MVISIVLMVMAGAIINKKVINPEHREISEEKTDFTISAENLQFHFANDPGKATKKYMDRVVEISGNITEVEANSMVMSNRVQVDFLDSLNSQLNIDGNVTIKGRCVGFDELLLMVKIDQATILKH